MLCERGFARRPFAAPLKSMLAVIGLTDEELNGSRKKQPSDLLCGRTPRYAMRTLGTEWGRDLIHPDLWVTLWTASIADLRRFCLVADDVRFPNEVAAIHKLGGEVWRVNRPGCESDGHESEAHIPSLNVDVELYNVEDIAALHKIVEQTLNRDRVPQEKAID